MTKIKGKYNIEELNEILQKARMNPALRRAIVAIREAMINHDPELVADLSAVKSFIIFRIDPANKTDHFQEDADYNKKVLGTDLYTYLDGLHHKYAFMTGTIPSGIMSFTATGIKQRDPSKREHPIIKLMKKEERDLWKQEFGGKG